MSTVTIELTNLIALLFLLVIICIILLKYFNKITNENRKLMSQVDKHSEELRKLEIETRKDSTKRQRSILKGQISETLAPWTIDAVNSVKELSFLGNPIDFIGFKGLDTEEDIEIKFIEIKTGKSRLTKSEKRIKEAVEAKRVEWKTIKINELPEVEEI